jgi:predicted enzyme related to lactoylglutathione lyase
MPRVVHFEISADEPERAVKFYTEVFGWKFNKWDGPMPYWLVDTGPSEEPGINGGLFVRRGPMTGHVNTVGVPSVDEFVEKIKAAGGECVLEKMAIPGVGWLAYCKDTEGSIFGLHQHDPSAK